MTLRRFTAALTAMLATPPAPAVSTVGPGEGLLAFGSQLPGGVPKVALNLSLTGDLAEAGANFFAMVRALDRHDIAAIAVAPIPEVGLGRAINDRLRRASRGPRRLPTS